MSLIFAYITFGFCILTLISWGIVLTYRNGFYTGWFKKMVESRFGEWILFITGLIVLFSIFWSFSPDAFWD